ncbi:hypothetical protein LSCM4_00913 [Leishmania orientalis]|uniref:Uncharacterized protein n=1 Tax=Leishmania orientalis TaxID=2249476 RepID=A0A836KJD4_9TRYP|nr:hypothetical protein LSCM4_00913 [Leishmania orientalis]
MHFRALGQRKGGFFLVSRAPRASALRIFSTRSTAIQSSRMLPCAATELKCPRRACASQGSESVSNEEEASLHLKSCFSAEPVQSAVPCSDDGTASLVTSIAELHQHRAQMASVYMGFLADRRVQYRDQLLLSGLGSIQGRMQVLLRRLLACHSQAAADDAHALPEAAAQMTLAAVRMLKETWMRINGVTFRSGEAAMRRAYIRELRDCYATLMCSGLLQSEGDVRLILSEMHSTDLIEPDASFYEALFMALWFLEEVRGSAGVAGERPAAGSPQTPEIVAGEVRQLRRSVAGDLAGHYMGHALAQPSASSTPTADGAPTHRAVRAETWEVFFATLANAQPAPKLLDLWWKRFLDWLDEQGTAVSGKSPIDAQDEGESAATGAPVPYQAIHAVLAWCAQSREMEKALNYFNAVNQRGVMVHATTLPHVSSPSPLAEDFTEPGCLTCPSKHTAVQQLQLALLVKLMASTKSIKMDGGLRSLVVRDVQRQVSPDVLYTAPWGVINDLIAGLSVPSAMQLLRRCSSSAAAATALSRPAGREDGSDERARNEEATAAKSSSTREIPFFVWASLLRRCSREHLQDEAESLFVFLRKKFPITSPEKRELIEIMMRMYTTMHPPDFLSTMDVFIQHVIRTPEGEPKVKPDAVLYELLIKAADTRNAAMMIFLEACAAGVTLTEELFEALMGSTQYKTVASLSRKLPHDYAASSLDAQLKIPADADAHLRREEALRARGKPLYDSTGDAG